MPRPDPVHKALDKLESAKAGYSKALRQQTARNYKRAAKARTEATKLDTHRKIVVGANVLAHIARNPDSAFAEYVRDLLNRAVTKPRERKALGLPDRTSGANDGPIDSVPLREKFASGTR